MSDERTELGPMNAQPLATDEAIEAAFVRRAHRGEPGDLRFRILEATAAISQDRGRLAGIHASIAPAVRRPIGVRMLLAVGLTVAALVGLLLVPALVGHQPRLVLPGLVLPSGPAVIRPADASPQQPDERLAFIRNDDVYLANGDGSGAIRVLHQDGVAFADPAWSPDGSRLALDAAGASVIVDLASGAITRLTGNHPAWSPTGDRLAVLGAGGALQIVDPATGRPERSYPTGGIGPLAWSPNGEWITMTSEGPMALVRIDLATGSVLALDTTFAHLDARREPAWSPDSARIAFVRYLRCNPGTCVTHVLVTDSAGSNEDEPLVTEADGLIAGQPLPDAWGMDSPAWSPDGAWLAVRWMKAVPGGLTPGGLIVARPDGSSSRVITSAPVETYAWDAGSDGIRYTAPAATGQGSLLWFASIDGSVNALGVDVDRTIPPSNSSFAVHAGIGPHLPAKPSNVATTPAAGTLTGDPPAAASPVDISAAWPTLASTWSDGCKPGTFQTKTGAPHLWPTVCTPTTPTVWTAAWSPDGSIYAALLPDASGSGTLTLARSNGTVEPHVQRLRGILGLTWSPDGQWLVVTGQDACYVLTRAGDLVRSFSFTTTISPTWSTGGGHFLIPTPDSKYPGLDGPLMVGGPDGANMHAIGTFPSPAAWAPDDSRFAFIRGGDAWTASVDGTDQRNVTSFPLGGASQVGWSPDGEWLAVVPQRGLWLLHPDGGGRRFVDLGATIAIHGLAWSPDSRELAVDATVGFDVPEVELLDPTLSRATVIASSFGPVWSPDGRFLGVNMKVADQQYGFDVMNPDGSGQRPLDVVPAPGFAWIP